MRTASVRTAIRPEVRRRRPDAEPVLREQVLERERERERIPRLRMQDVLQHQAVPLAVGDGPRAPANEAVDRFVLPLGLGQRS